MNEGHQNSSVAIGSFDGVHIGHQKLLRKTVKLAEEEKLLSKVFTFTAPPKIMLNGPDRSIILPFSKKVELLSKFVDQVIVADFERIKDLNPRQFVKRILIDRLQASRVVVGHDWRFGQDKAGSAAQLKKLGKDHFHTRILDPVTESGKPVSSTRIRNRLKEGEIQKAANLLGRPPALYGRVDRGNKIGSEIGFPTANLSISKRILIPKDGVYAAAAKVQEETYSGALYIGNRPTFEDQERTIEIHLLTEEDIDVYGTEMEVFLAGYLREQREFSNREELASQIKRDIETIEEILESEKFHLQIENSHLSSAEDSKVPGRDL